MEKGLLEKTGKTLSHWKKIVLESGIEKHKQIIDFLKKEHGFTHGYANFVSLKARESDAASIDDETLLHDQYKGKESLKGIYDELLKKISPFGSDISFVPKKSSVSVVRKKQFALIKPATKTRIDLGLKLKGKDITDRLGDSGPFGSMCTHRVKLSAPDEVNDELIDWLHEAYQGAS